MCFYDTNQSLVGFKTVLVATEENGKWEPVTIDTDYFSILKEGINTKEDEAFLQLIIHWKLWIKLIVRYKNILKEFHKLSSS